jgi:hypothetical protein
MTSKTPDGNDHTSADRIKDNDTQIESALALEVQDGLARRRRLSDAFGKYEWIGDLDRMRGRTS